ncbi:MAG: hypothetical protein KTR24_06165 [Saprospiraceae bacterium]|nr:hypothetical protein [Saprospiraceae bacterium]
MRALAAVYTSLFLIVFSIRCTYDNELDLTPCPDQPSFKILSLENTACGAAIGSFEIELDFDRSSGYGSGNAEQSNFRYRIGDGTFQSDGSFENLSAGSYRVEASLREGCEFSETIQIENKTGLQLQTAIDNDDCEGNGSGKITIEAIDGNGSVNYTLNGGVPQTENVFENLTAGNYTVEAVDEAGCTVIQEVEVKAEVNPNEVYTIISENCATSGCHGGTQSPNLSTNQNIEDRKARIRSRTSNRTMPPSSSGIQLTDEQIELIKCWANE